MTDNLNITNIVFQGDVFDDITLKQEAQIIALDMLENASLYPASWENIVPISLNLAFQQRKFVIGFLKDDQVIQEFMISLSPYIRLLREYKEICAAYKNALTHSHASAIETIDMARRGIHNQAAELMQQNLKDKMIGNHDAFRALFSIIFIYFNKNAL